MRPEVLKSIIESSPSNSPIQSTRPAVFKSIEYSGTSWAYTFPMCSSHTFLITLNDKFKF